MYVRHKIGKLGEQLAVNYLEKENYSIIERNFKCKQGEIDIIAVDKNELVFIEVKARTNKVYGVPVEAVNIKKKKHLIKAIEYYLYLNSLENKCIRIDVMEVYIYKNKYRINHIKQII